VRLRRLGKTDLTVSEIGLGCQSLGGGLFHGSERSALNVVAAAVDAGITFFDTADHYSLGRSEVLLGRGLQAVRERVVIATKVGTRYSRAASLALRMRPMIQPVGRFLRPLKPGLDRVRSTQRRADFSLGYLRSAVEASLKRLGTDRLDLLQLHKPPPELLSSGEAEPTLEALRREGKVRYVGIACHTVAEALQYVDLPEVDTLQVPINLLDQTATRVLLPKAIRRNVGIIARNPRAAGLLTRSYDDVTGETYALDRAALAADRRRAARFAFLAGGIRTLDQAAIQFVLQLPGVATTVPRALGVEQVREFVAATRLPRLTRGELDRIRELDVAPPAALRRYSYRSNLLERLP
jgi:aryl-alcohol dehydrogenase-like predicted oxidoreductase